MKTNHVAKAALAAGLCSTAVLAQSCSSVLVPAYKAPSVASGWQAQLVADGLKKPRSLQFDSTGALLLVESGKGLSRITFKDNGGTCLQVDKSTLLVDNTGLNHGLALSNDGKTIYASTVKSVFAFEYDQKTGTVSDNPRVIIDNMSNNDLVTRTLLVSKKKDGYIVVSRGGTDDLAGATVLSSGLSQIRAFDLSNFTSDSKPYNFDSSGRVLGWGLRNSVGVAEHPTSGGIYSVENSIDDVTRDGVDIHENNPGEELNFHGLLSDPVEGQPKNYGHPNCFAVWDTAEIGDNDGLAVGKQFAMTENSTMTDEICAKDFVPPRLTFPPHQAPLDIKFNTDGSVAYVSFHGSFNKKNPVGYRISSLTFDPKTGEPTAPITSTDALSDIMSNPDDNECPENCFRPAGLTFDSAGRLWLTSDTTGEIYVLQQVTSKGSPTATASGTIVTSTKGPNSAGVRSTAALGYAAAVAVVGALFAVM